jgi:hypothetical protein
MQDNDKDQKGREITINAAPAENIDHSKGKGIPKKINNNSYFIQNGHRTG